MDNYDDIINLPHHQSAKRPHMSMHNRAAQFAPFAALTGYDDQVEDTANARLLTRRVGIDEDKKAEIDRVLQYLKTNPDRIVKVTYFDYDYRGEIGRYVVRMGKIEKIDSIKKHIRMDDATVIGFDDLFEMEIV